MADSNNKLVEYNQLNENIRHYHNQRFAQLTLWLAISAVLLSVFFSDSRTPSKWEGIILKAIGIISSFAFWIMDLRMVDHWRHFWRRLQKLEKELCFDAWLSRPKRKWFGSTKATYLLYSTLIAFWIITLIWPSIF